MIIRSISATPVHIPYAAPVGPYIGRGGSAGTLGASALVVRIEADNGLVGWGEGLGEFGIDVEMLLKGRLVGDLEGVCNALEAAGVARGPLSGVEMALWDLIGKRAELPLCLGWGSCLCVNFCCCFPLSCACA